MKSRWKHLSHQVVHKNPWYSVRQDRVLNPEGKEGTYTVVVKSPGVFIVAVNNKNEVALIRLFRYPTNMHSIEVPAGGTESDSPILAAKRELQEETGLRARSWKKLGRVQANNGISDQIHYFFLATELTQTKNNKQKEEGIENVSFVPFRKILDMIMKGKITDNGSISALLFAAIKLGLLRSSS